MSPDEMAWQVAAEQARQAQFTPTARADIPRGAARGPYETGNSRGAWREVAYPAPLPHDPSRVITRMVIGGLDFTRQVEGRDHPDMMAAPKEKRRAGSFSLRCKNSRQLAGTLVVWVLALAAILTVVWMVRHAGVAT